MSNLYFELDYDDDPYQSIVLDRANIPESSAEDLGNRVLGYEDYVDWRHSLPERTKRELELPTRFDLAYDLIEQEPLEALQKELLVSNENLERDIRSAVKNLGDYEMHDLQDQIKEVLHEYGGKELVDMDEFTDYLEVRFEDEATEIAVE